MLRVTIAGAVTRDRSPAGDRPGGSVLYGARALEGIARVTAITGRASGDRALGDGFGAARVLTQARDTTVTFANRYDDQDRVAQWVHAPAPMVTPTVPEPTDLLILAPVLGELDLESWASAAPASAMVTLGAQGALRSAPTIPGPVVPTDWHPSGALLDRLDAVFLSTEDVRHQPDLLPHLRSQLPLVVLTAGAEGATAFAAGRSLHVPARRVPAIDPTGAGDTFHAVGAARRAWGGGREPALGAAARAAAHCVGQRIPPLSKARAS
jgi:sugar/nucleoside kinase (ribokinase family)